jgi:uncharacterized protein (TIGR02246 family)
VIVGRSGNTTKATQYATDADWMNAFGDSRHGREAIAQKFDELSRSTHYKVGVANPDSQKMDVRFVRPNVTVVHSSVEIVGQIDPTIERAMPTRKIHIQYALSKEGGNWLIQSELIMDEEHDQKPT